jgi:hypothetical protein
MLTSKNHYALFTLLALPSFSRDLDQRNSFRSVMVRGAGQVCFGLDSLFWAQPLLCEQSVDSDHGANLVELSQRRRPVLGCRIKRWMSPTIELKASETICGSGSERSSTFVLCQAITGRPRSSTISVLHH